MTSFRTAMEARDLDTAIGLLADGVVFRSPAVFGQYSGKQAVAPVIRAVATVFEDFRYVREYKSADGRAEALLFEARVGDKRIEGADFLTRDETGQITELVVMLRPLSGLLALVDHMREALQAIAQ